MLVRLQGEKGTLIHCWWELTTLENNMEAS
jgi:hypothetical protein